MERTPNPTAQRIGRGIGYGVVAVLVIILAVAAVAAISFVARAALGL